MSDQVEELIKEIAVKHNISLSRDDPILVLQTINNRLLQIAPKLNKKYWINIKEKWKASRYVGKMKQKQRLNAY
jgi:hypothetical protein